MSLRHLPFFVAVAEEENFRRAAERLHMTQSALSRRIQDLERELALPLFERGASGTRLTPAGRSLLADSLRLIDDYARARRQAQQVQRGEVGSLRVAISGISVRHPSVPKWMARFRAERPGVDLQVLPMTSWGQVAALVTGEIDAGFVYGPLEGLAEVATRPAFTHDFLLALPEGHPLAARRRLALADLADEGFIWSTRTTGRREGPYAAYDRRRATIYDRMIAACRAGGLTPRIVAEAHTAEARLNLVAAGMGLSFVDDLQRGESPGIVLRKVADFSVPITVHFAWRRDGASPLLARFAELGARRKN